MNKSVFYTAKIGDELSELRIPLSRTLIVATAIASRDYQDVHHDPDLAREKGSEDIFMNILTSNGFAERFVRDWAGPDSIISRIKLRLGVPNYPYDVMVCTGSVTEVREDSSEVDVSVRFMNSRGAHASGLVTVSFAGNIADCE